MLKLNVAIFILPSVLIFCQGFYASASAQGSIETKLKNEASSIDRLFDRTVQRVLNQTKGSIPSNIKERVLRELRKQNGFRINSNELLNKVNQQLPESIKNKLPDHIVTKLNGVKMDRMERFSYWPGLFDQAHLMSLFTPETGTNHPLIVYIHGGGWNHRPKSNPHWLGQAVKRGYAVATVNYRLAQEGVFPAAIEDLNTAIRFIKSNSTKLNIDPERIGLWGTSAGGHLATLVATSAASSQLDLGAGEKSVSRKVRALVDFCGPTDLFSLGSTMTPGQTWDTVSATAPLSLFLGSQATSDKEKALAASPITYVSSACPAILVAHGTKDEIIPFSQSEKFVEPLKSLQVPVEFYPLEGRGHDIERGANIELALNFFDRKLKK